MVIHRIPIPIRRLRYEDEFQENYTDSVHLHGAADDLLRYHPALLFARRFNELGAGVAALGASEMAFALTSTLAAPFMGAMADRFGRRPLILVSLAAYALAFCGYRFSQTALSIIAIRGLCGAFAAGLVPAVNRLAANAAPRDHQAQWMGFINGSASIGWIVGPILGGILYDRWGYNAALTVSIIVAILTFLVAHLAQIGQVDSLGHLERTVIKATLDDELFGLLHTE